MKTFREYIAEEISDKLSHFTTIKNLIKILEQGYISGRQYKMNEKNFQYTYNQKRQKKVDRPKELCLIRKAYENNIIQIANQPIDNIKIVFDWDNIRNLRGVGKPHPISEYSVQDSVNSKNIIKRELQNKGIITPKEGETIFNFAKSIKDIKYWEENKKKIITWVFENFKYKKEEDRKKIVDALISIEKEGNREGEERIDLSKNSIPVSSKYIKIILGGQGIANYMSGRDIEVYKAFAQDLYSKNKISEKEYKKTINFYDHINENKKKQEKKLYSLINKYNDKDPELFDFKWEFFVR